MGATALHMASWLGDVAVTRTLIGKGAAVEDRRNRFGSMPLDWACHGSTHCQSGGKSDHLGVVQALLEEGAETSYLAGRFQEGGNEWAAPAWIELLAKTMTRQRS